MLPAAEIAFAFQSANVCPNLLSILTKSSFVLVFLFLFEQPRYVPIVFEEVICRISAISL